MQKLIRLMGTSLLVLMCEQAVAEGTFQMDAAHPQPLDSNSRLLIHVDDAKPFIRLHLCQKDDSWTNDKDESVNAVGAKIYSTRLDDGKYVADVELAALTSSTANISCANTMDNPLPAIPVSGEQMQYRVASAGVYMVIPSHSSSPYERWDVSTVALASDNVDPTADDGNLFSYKWMFRTDDYSAATAATTKMYVLVPGGFEDTNYIWALDLQQFSGNVYDIVANNIGLDAPYSGISTPQDKSPTVQEKFPVYLSYPKGANPHPAPDLAPQLIDTLTFTDDAGNDNIISPDGDAVEETGIFSFTPNVSGTYAITIDINRDGDFGANDRLLLGAMEANTQVDVSWDGKDAAGDVVSQAEYGVKLELRIGEYHFVGSDVETSGGGVNNGLTILRAEDETTLIGTQIFWDDKTLLSASSNLPAGALSSEASVGAHRHTWGDFTGAGIGNESYIDTYVYGKSSVVTSKAIVEHKDAPNITSNGGDYSVIIEVNEQSTTVTRVETSGGSGIYTYLLSDKDAALFNIDNTGALSFKSAPAYDTPKDSDADNDYILVVTVNDGALNTQQAITVRVKKLNTPPVAANQSISTREDQPKVITLVASDAETASLSSYTIVTAPQHGQLAGSGANFTYTPTKDYSGGDSFTFKANDGALDSNTATVNITVSPQNDAPVATSQSVSTKEDQSKSITLVATDVDSPNLSYSLIARPQHGQLTGSGANLIYTPNKDHSGIDSFTFKANDGAFDSNTATVNITVSPQNDAPVALSQTLTTNQEQPKTVTLSATDLDGNSLSYTLVTPPTKGQLSGTGKTLVYIPNKGASGRDSFSFKASDGLADSNIAHISIDIVKVNDAPEADVQTVLVTQDTPTAITLSGSDKQGTTLSFTVISLPENGTLSGDAPYLIYTPETGYFGTDSLSFKVNDGEQDSNIATVSIEVLQDLDGDGIADVTDPDDDGDGIDDVIEGEGDTDGDGIPDSRDLDSDGDGIPDSKEGQTDTDGDGIPDYQDTSIDDDHDGIPDVVEGRGDFDGDGIPNFLDIDSDNDGLVDGFEAGISGTDSDGDGIDDGYDVDQTGGVDANGDGIDDDIVPLDTDKDGKPDYIDKDSDNDLIPDAVEASQTRKDTDGDGIADNYDIDVTVGSDADGDGIDDRFDIDIVAGFDADGDGINDAKLIETDKDADGVADFMDQDSDNDGIWDTAEADAWDRDDDADGIDDKFDYDFNVGKDDNNDGILDGVIRTDTDADGIIDMHDLDSDNDGLLDTIESGSRDEDGDGQVDMGNELISAPKDTDGDGQADFRDLDSDDDQGFDIDANPEKKLDKDNDGRIDTTLDRDLDGIDDSIDNALDLFGTALGVDGDGDGVSAGLDLDDDNDGISDVIEGLHDSDHDTISDHLDKDSDNDGLSDAFENDRPAPHGLDGDRDGIDDAWDVDMTAGIDADNDGIDDRYSVIDTDKDGLPDNLDTDSDNDGISDTQEQVMVELMDRDSDMDGIDDAFDVDVTSGVDTDRDGIDDSVFNAIDFDGDGIANFRDLDSDGDGVLDAVEGIVDTDKDGQADFLDIDSDNDNILDGNENGDFNQDGINDRLQASSKVETGIDGAGAINLLGLLGLLCVALIRRTKACIVMLLSVLALFSVTVQANESCALEGAVQESGCWYLGAGVGVSRLMPDKHDTSWRVSDSQDTAFKLLAGYGFTEHWFGEISYENMGAASLTNANPAIKDRPEIGYSAFGGSLGYWLFEQSNTWNLYAKTGLAFLQTDTGPYVEQSHSRQWTLGVGAQWRFSDHWFARVGIDAYDRDARVVGLTIGRYFGGSAKSVVKHVEPAVIVASSSIVLDHDNDGVTDKMDLCPTTAAEAVVDEDGCPLLETITLHVQFDTASWVVKPAYLEQINSVSEKLKQFKKARFTVEGHTDWQGKQADNQILSEHRAEAVAEILMQKTGMDRDRFTVAGHGELQPKADNNTDEGRIENRRVEIRIDNR